MVGLLLLSHVGSGRVLSNLMAEAPKVLALSLTIVKTHHLRQQLALLTYSRLWNNMDVVAVTKCWYQWIHFCSVLVQRSSSTSTESSPTGKKSRGRRTKKSRLELTERELEAIALPPG